MKLKIIALAVAASLCGCTTAILKPISTEVDKTSATVDTALRSVRAGEPAETAQKQATSIKYVNSVWLPVKKIDVTYNKEAELNLSRIVAVNRRFTNLGDSVSYITALTGVPTSMAVTANSSTSGASVTAPADPMLGVVPVITGSATQSTGSATR